MQKQTWRRPQSIPPSPFMNLGLEIGGTKLQLVLGDEAGKICERRKLPVNPGGGAAGIRQQIEGAVPELLRGRRIQRAGVGFGGPVDWRTGKICRSHQIEGWSEFDLGGWLQHLAGAPVVDCPYCHTTYQLTEAPKW